MMNKYNVSYNRLAELLLPTYLRGARLLGVVCAMVAPIGRLHGELMVFRQDTAYRVGHNGQVCYLRAMLNDKFDPVDRGITITEDGDDVGMGMVLHERAVAVHQLLPWRIDGSLEMFRRGFNGTSRVGFWVNIPERLRGIVDEGAVRAIVNAFKLASIRYDITYI